MSAQLRSLRRRKPAKKRMLLIVNPYATTVSDRLKNLVVYALQGLFDVEAVATQAQNHATEIGREAQDGGYDVVVAFGGDGTLNEVANGLAGTDLPVAVLPGGSTNVVGRTLGIPNDVVDATEHLLSLADDWRPRKIDLGMVDDRYFVFSCGVGIDATVVRRVDANPKLKASAGPYYYSWAGVSGFYRKYLVNPIRVRTTVDGHEPVEGVTTIVQNSDPFTYFASRPIRVCEGIALDDGTLSLAVLKRATQRDMPTLISSLFSETKPAGRHKQVTHFDDVTHAVVETASTDKQGAPRPFPLQVDGDYIGERERVELRAAPSALTVVA
ncbi:MAG TPA: diacylglycerol kinase family protein [Solirubrobacterales bacterium]|nr:diacylglycerol kinase family protein [Solirubrobacterales bacterium]